MNPALLGAVTGRAGEELNGRFFLGAALLVPVILSWLAVRHLKALWIYTLSGAAAVLAAWMTVRELSFVLLTAVFWLVRGSVRIKKGRIRKEYMDLPAGEGAVPLPDLSEIPMFLDEPSPVHLFLPAGCYLLSLPMGEKSLYCFIFALLCADVAVCFVYRYLSSFYEYVAAHQSIAALPVRTMKKIIYLLLIPALLFLSLAMLPAALLKEEPLTKLRFEAVETIPGQQEFQPTSDTPSGPEALLSQLTGKEPRELPEWIRIAFQAFLWAVVLAAAVLLVTALYRALRAMNGAFLKEEEDVITFLGEEETREKLSVRRKKKMPRFFLDPSEKIRKKFRTSALWAMKREKRNLSGTETPGQLERAMEQAELFEEPGDSGLLRRLYEKARYSQEACSSREAELAEKLKQRKRK